jgi:hypothetical protein
MPISGAVAKRIEVSASKSAHRSQRIEVDRIEVAAAKLACRRSWSARKAATAPFWWSDIGQAGAPVIGGAMARANQHRIVAKRWHLSVLPTTGHANRSEGEQALQIRHVGGKSALDPLIDCPKV